MVEIYLSIKTTQLVQKKFTSPNYQGILRMSDGKFTIAVHPDDYTQIGKPPESDAAAPRWCQLLEAAGHTVKKVDVRRSDILQQLAGCDGFMWRWAHFDGMSRIARRLLPVVERELNIAVYPDQHTCWHYDDKIAQSYLLPALGVPYPKTWVWFDREYASHWASTAQYPMVLKLSGGAASQNVKLVKSVDEARFWIDRLFTTFVTNLGHVTQKTRGVISTRLRSAARVLIGRSAPEMVDHGFEPQAGYIMFQEFLPNNEFDTRVTVIGNRAFAYRRMNRPNDFRASGSGRLDWDRYKIDQNFIRLAFLTAEQLHSQSCAIDGMYANGECVVGEVSYTYVSEFVHDCPGHWTCNDGELKWVEGMVWPEEAQVADFLVRLEERRSALQLSFN